MTLRNYTRPDILARLLAHGPLQRCEVIAITGWYPHKVKKALEILQRGGEVRRVHIDRHSVWTLTDIARVPTYH